jgi:lysophospholipid acyltransferase
MPPGRKRAAAERAVVGFFYLGLYSALASSYGYERMLEDRFLAKSMLARVAFVQATGFFARTKYYGGWSIACVEYAP